MSDKVQDLFHVSIRKNRNCRNHLLAGFIQWFKTNLMSDRGWR